MVREPQVKGVVFRSVLDTLDAVRGAAFRDEVERRLEGAFREAWQHGGVVSAGWYPVAWYRELWRATRSLEPGDELVCQVGRESLELDLRVFHKAIMRRLSPSTLMRISQGMFGRYFDTGRIQIVESERRRLRAKWTGVEGFDDTLWMEHLAASEHLIRLTAGDARLEVISGGSGDATDAEVRVLW